VLWERKKNIKATATSVVLTLNAEHIKRSLLAWFPPGSLLLLFCHDGGGSLCFNHNCCRLFVDLLPALSFSDVVGDFVALRTTRLLLSLDGFST